MMITATIVFYLVVLGLTGIAIYIQVTASTLSLPIPSSTTISLILLPWISALANFTSRLIASTTTTTTTAAAGNNKRNRSQEDNPRPSAPLLRLAGLLLPTLHIFQSILSVILLTLLSQTLTPGDISNCRLTTRWQRLWIAHDRRSIETIQDQFSCCGFNSVKDMAWPRDTCAALHGRNRACRGDWDAALRRTSGLGLGICLVVLGFQVYQFTRFTGARGFWDDDGEEEDGVGRQRGGYKRILQGTREVGGEEDVDRVVEDVSDDDDGEGRRVEESSRLLEEGGGRGSRVAAATRESSGTQTDYGSVEDRRGGAVVPSGLGGEEENHWR